MSNFLRTRALWADDTDFLWSEAEDFDIKTAAAINGEGGVYALVDPLIVGGAPGTYVEFDVGVTLSDLLFMTGGVESYGPVYLGGSGLLTVDKDSTFLGQNTFQDSVFCNGSVSCNDNVYLGSASDDDVVINGTGFAFSPFTFHDDVTIGDDATDSLTVDASTHLYGPVVTHDLAYFTNGATFAGPVGFTGTGKIIHRQKTISAAGNQSVVAANYDTVYIPAGVMANGEYVMIDDTGAQDGMRIRFFTGDPTNTIGAATPGPGLTAPLKYATGSQQNVEYERIAGAWRLSGSGDF